MKSRNQGRNPLPLRDLGHTRDYLFLIGSSLQLRSKDFFQSIRRNEDKKMSYEYKIFKKLCPIYGRSGCPVLNMLDPYRAYSNVEEDKYLWTNALVKLTVDQSTEDEYEQADERSLHAKQAYCSISEQSNLKEIELKKRYYEQKEVEKSKIVSAINSWNKKNLFLCLTFRGLLAYLFSEYEQQNALRAKKGRRNAKEKHKEKAVELKKHRLNDSNDRIRQIIRNQSILKEAPFLRDFDLHESLGFDVIGLLRRISIELISQFHIDASNDFYLVKRAMERYLAEFERFFFDSLYDPVRDTYQMHLASVRSQKGVKSIDEQSQEDVSNVLRLNNYRGVMAEHMAWLVQQEIMDLKKIVTKSISLEHSLEGEANKTDAKVGSVVIFHSTEL